MVDGTDHFLKPIEQALAARYQVDRFDPRFIKAPVIGSSANKVLFELQFRRFLASNDVVLFEWAGTSLIRATHMPKRSRIITRLHSIEIATAAHLVDWSKVDTVVVASHHIGERLVEIADQPQVDLRICNYGVDLGYFRPAEHAFRHRVGMLCRIVPIKRIYEAVLGIADLRRNGYPFTLDVVGKVGDNDEDKRYYWAVRRLIEQLDLSEAVTLQGHMPDVREWYCNLDVFLSNSFWEGQQVALLEAMASGCFCLSHSWGGADEVLPSEQLYDTNTDMVTKLIAYAGLSDDEKHRQQARMRAIAEARFDQQRMIREMMALVEAPTRPAGH